MFRLFRTTAFRLSLLYACLYSLLSAAGLGVTYWSTASRSAAQIDERLRLETNALIGLYRSRQLPALAEAVRQRSRDDGSRKIFFYLLEGPDSERLGRLFRSWPPGLDQTYATLRLSEVFTDDPARPAAGDPIRVLATRLPGGHRLLVGRDLNDEQALLDYTLNVVLAVSSAIFLLAMLGSLGLGRYTLRRIDTVSGTAAAIIKGDLSRRIPLTRRADEFDELGRQLNAMLERIEDLMAGMRQVTDNVAHDLRGPLSRLRSRLEVTLLESRRPREYRAVLEQTLADADELLDTFNALLGIAQAEAGIQRARWTEQDLAALAADLAELYGALAEEKSLRLTWSASGQTGLAGDRQLLAQALGNLLDNAIKYTPAGGRIELRVKSQDGAPALIVADTGPGIPAEQRERVLERFVRLDSARSTPGSGLGLSLVKAVAKLHGAELRLEDNRPGLRVVLRFPPPDDRHPPRS